MKKYEDPFDENEDFCGIRIILYYLEDIEKVQKIIENKSDKLQLNEFGYRSNHLVIKINNSWCVTPNYKGLEDIKIEIQIRTSLMHTWAAIEHQLGYKANQELDERLKRKLYLISAKLEDADIQFQEVKHQADNYQKSTIEKSVEVGKFIGTELNIDTMQALLTFYFPDYEDHKASDEHLLDDIIRKKISISDVSDCAIKIKPLIEIIEKHLDKIPTKSNIMRYGLETFIENFRSSENHLRDKIIDELINSK